MPQRLICIIGTDGSGKTTLSDAVVDTLVKQGEPARRVWLGAESYLMKPVRGLLKAVWYKRPKHKGSTKAKLGDGSQRTNYAQEIERKNALAKKYSWMVRLYLSLVFADYRLQVALKRWRNRDAKTIVADRYLFDVTINCGLTLGWSPDEVVAFTSKKLSNLALPELRVFLRVEPEVSLARKDDIHDIDYLRLRFKYYEAVARAFGFETRDGTFPISRNRDWLLNEIKANQQRSYVLYVHSNNTDIGGADKVLVLMAKNMRDFDRPKQGNRVAVCLRLQTPIVTQYARFGIPVFHLGFVRPQLSRGIRGILGLAFHAPISIYYFWRLFRRENPDIVHVNDLYDFLPAIAARLCGVPVVWHIRIIVERQRLRGAFAKIVARLSAVSISVSNAVRDHYFPVVVPGHEARVIYDLGNAALVADDRDPTICTKRPSDLTKGGALIAMVGRIEPWKGQNVFVDAVRQLSSEAKNGNTFVIAGGKVDGKEEFYSSVEKAAAQADVTLLGERDDIPELVRAADISVHASTTPDPFPGVVIESLLAGAATIAANAGGAVEMINSGEHGLLTAPGDSAALSAALNDLLTSGQAPRKRFGAAARSRALSLVNASLINQSISDIYQGLRKPS